MDWSAAHAGFVTASYVVSVFCIAGLIAYVFAIDRRNKKRLAEFENAKS
jgi:heme exporter protein CcmD